jgi:hypothetical protein
MRLSCGALKKNSFLKSMRAVSFKRLLCGALFNDLIAVLTPAAQAGLGVRWLKQARISLAV